VRLCSWVLVRLRDWVAEGDAEAELRRELLGEELEELVGVTLGVGVPC